MLFEQDVPRWARGDERARLDIVFRTAAGETPYVDVTVVEPVSSNPEVTAHRARWAGAGLRVREQAKHLRYPGSGLDVFAVGACGRWGEEAVMFARAMTAHLDDEERARETRRIRARVSTKLHWWKAEELLTATAGAARPWQSRR